MKCFLLGLWERRFRSWAFRLAFGTSPRFVCVCFATALVPVGSGLSAQVRSGVAGRVMEAAGEPLGFTTVEALGTRWTTQTGADGRFELALPQGTWSIVFNRIGFRPDTVGVVIASAEMATLDVRLAPASITLRGLTVEAAGSAPMSRTVTTETVRQVPPLAEPDVFRALVLLPGVSQPNDLKGRIHLAGGSSDETGIRLDGHPLQDPFHLLGLMGAFNVAALERADVLVHHLPASVDGHLSGVIQMETRQQSAAASTELVASLLSSSATVARRLDLAGIDVLASGRITYLDKFVELLAPEGRIGGDEIPLAGYHDGLLRVGRSWGDGWRTELLGFTTRDVFRATVRDSHEAQQPLRWGESLVGARLVRRSTDWEFTARAGLNRSSARMDGTAVREEFVRSQREWASAAVEVIWKGERWRASTGGAVDRRSLESAWATSGIVHQIFSPNTPLRHEGSESHTEQALFGELEHDLGRGLRAGIGARLARVGGDWYPAPRAVLAYAPVPSVRIEAAMGRRLQFDAELEEPIEGNITPPRFLLDAPRVADVAAVAGTWRHRSAAGTGTVGVETFVKHYTERTLLREREPWDELPAEFPDFVRTRGHSRGAAASVQWTWADARLVQASYTFQQVREHVGGGDYPTSWDAPHDLSVFGSTPAWRGWVVNAAYAGRSGRAITPVEARVFVPAADLFTQLNSRYIRGPRNSVRVTPYHRLDLGARRSWRTGGAEWTGFVQVLNVLFRENPVDYDWYQYFSDLEPGERPRSGRPGLPILPSVGVEVRW